MKLPGMRWWIAVLLFGAAVLNYVDRQTLSALAPTIQHDLAIDDRAYATVVNLFLVAYTLAYLVAGWVTDWLGTQCSMTVFVAWWSIANALTAAATGFTSLGWFRFALGLGEAGVWPAASKAVSEWFPARERALAIGFYTTGATAGATLAPYLVIPLAAFPNGVGLPALEHYLPSNAGWRLAFLVTGALGLVWVAFWVAVYRPPGRHRFISSAERRLILGGSEALPDATVTRWSWRQIISNRTVWLLLVGRLLTDPVWYFFQFWYPKYLHSERGVEQKHLTITWVIYAAAGLGSIAGGWLSGLLVRRGIAPAVGRLWIMLGSAVLMPLSPYIACAGGVTMANAAAVVVVFAALSWLINVSALIVDVVPRHSLGTVFGIVAAGSTIGGILMNTMVATMVAGSAPAGGFLDGAVNTTLEGVLRLVSGHGYPAWFWVAAILHPIALLILWLGRVHRVSTIATQP